MKDKEDSQEQETMRGKGVLLTIRLSAKDAEELTKAFAEGKLKHLGITDLYFPPRADQSSPDERMELSDPNKVVQTRVRDIGLS